MMFLEWPDYISRVNIRET